jgi:hypothetical protein
MARYYFHIRNQGGFVRDEEGQDFPDLEAVKWEAEQSAREIFAERVKAGVKLDGELIEVHDRSGAIVYSVKLANLLN